MAHKETFPRCPSCHEVLDPVRDIASIKGPGFGYRVFICVKCGTILSVGV